MIQARCPRCRVSLERRTPAGVVFYGCPTCRGFAIEVEALKTLLPANEVDAIWKEAAGAGDVGCSHCDMAMESVVRRQGLGTVALDVCRSCQMLWLDAGEWQDVDSNSERKSGVIQVERARDVGTLKILATLVGLPVEREKDMFHSRPWITWATIALCVVASIWGFFNEEFALKYFAHYSSQKFPVSQLTALTSFFLHGGVLHLVFNMYAFWMFGDNVEDHLGKWRYVALLVCATLFGDMLADLLDPRLSDLPGVGASGGIAGLIAYYLVRFPQRRFVVMFLFHTFAIPAMYFGAFYAVTEVVGAFAQIGGASMVSHLAHLGGAGVGVAFALFQRDRFARRSVRKLDA